MSSIGWVDFSSNDRIRVQDVLALLKEQGTLDELGIGQVRDAFSDLLFPGFSTIQTTARYFLAVPKILLDWGALTPSKRRKLPLAGYLRQSENDLARTLKANCEAVGRTPEGVIGHTVVESGGVARRPSSTYWNGLRVFGIVRSEKSLAEFCREYRSDHEDLDTVDSDEGNDDPDHRYEAEVRRPPGVHGPWAAGMTLDLKRREAEFLSERFRVAKGCEQSVAAQLLSTDLAERAMSGEFQSFSAFSVWAANQAALSQLLRARVRSAQRFSDAVEGAHIIYNRLLAEKLEYDVLRERCLEEFKSWRERATQRQVFHPHASDEWLEAPSAVGFGVSKFTEDFLSEWNKAMCRSAPQNDLDILVSCQAERNKPGRSLLVRLPRTQSTWYGMKELDYRWRTSRRMLSDVTKGLKCST